MRYLIAVFLVVIFVSPVFAETIKITYTNAETGEIIQEDIISEEEIAAFNAYADENTTYGTFPKHLTNWARTICRKKMENVIEQKTNYAPQKLSEPERKTIIKNLKLKKGELRGSININ